MRTKSVNSMSLEDLQKQKDKLAKQQKDIANLIKLKQREEEKERARKEYEEKVATALRLMKWCSGIKLSDGTTIFESFQKYESGQFDSNGQESEETVVDNGSADDSATDISD